MALTATIHSLNIDLSDVDRGVYEQLEIRVARQPSETVEYMLMRVLAYCLEYGDGISMTEGVAAGSEPAILFRDLTGRTTGWIEVGMPDPARIHRGHKLAGRVAVYTHRDVRKLLAEMASANIHRVADIPVYEFNRGFVEEVAGLLERRSDITLSVTERELYLHINNHSVTTTIVEHRVRPKSGDA
jgi:uncharacterized protein YaeQ